MGCTLLLLLVILLHDFSTTVAAFDKSGDFATRQSLPCRRCKFYSVKVGRAVVPVGAGAAAPPDEESSGKKTNVGAVVGFTFLLVFILVIGFVCIYRNRRSASSLVKSANLQPVVVQPPQAEEVVQRPAREGLAKPGNARGPEKKEGAGEVETKGKDDDDDDDDNDKVARLERPNVEQGEGIEERRDVLKKKKKKKKEVAGEVIEPEGDAREGKRRVQAEEDVRKAAENDEKVVEELIESKQEELRQQRKHGEDVKGKKQEVVKEQGNSVGLHLPKKYTYRYLMNVTKKFDPQNRLGGGAFGTVYKGTLPNGTNVAVKCLKYGGKKEDFQNEVDALGRADHPNLVKLIGYCDEGLMKILVYDYMKNGSLDEWIFNSYHNKSLTWPEMKNIILGIARGLEYLHEKCHKKILHRDLKPANIVLDGNKNAKLCDFGFVKQLNKDQSSTSTAWAGTEWYMAPEAKISRISDKLDVYSFGVVVLEIIFGKRYRYLVSSDRANNTKQVKLHVLIKNLGEDMRKNGMEIKEFGNLAINCIKEKPEERPTMSKVVAAIRDLEAGFKEAKAGRN